MQTNLSNVYAVGDVAESFSVITGKPIYRPLGSTANKMGRIAGDVITGGDLEHRGVLGTGIFRIFDLHVGQTGLTVKSQTQVTVPKTNSQDLHSETLGAIVKAGDATGMSAVVTTETEEGKILETECRKSICTR